MKLRDPHPDRTPDLNDETTPPDGTDPSDERPFFNQQGYYRSRKDFMPNRRRNSGEFASGFLVLGLIFGALGAIGWQLWQLMVPMLEPPPKPTFTQVLSPPTPGTPLAPTPLPVPTLDPSKAEFQLSQQARVIEPLGLILRLNPESEGERIGGIVLGETVTVLATSSDAKWQKVRRELNGQEGWIKAGNLGSMADPVPTPFPQAVAVDSPPASRNTTISSSPNAPPPPVPRVPDPPSQASTTSTSPELAPAPSTAPIPPVSKPVGVGGQGRVIEPIGLAIRGEPKPDGGYVGGVGLGETVTVLDVSPDGQWQRIRRESNGQEGWVRAGNLGQ